MIFLWDSFIWDMEIEFIFFNCYIVLYLFIIFLLIRRKSLGIFFLNLLKEGVEEVIFYFVVVVRGRNYFKG